MKTRLASKMERKIPRVVIPKIQIKCEPLNVERIIDFENNKVIDKKLKNVQLEKKSSKAKTDSKSKKNRKKTSLTNNLAVSHPINLENLEMEVKKVEKGCETKAKISHMDITECIKKRKLSMSKTQQMCENESALYSYNETTSIKEKTVQTDTSETVEGESRTNLVCESFNQQELLFPSPFSNIDESCFMDLDDVCLEVAPGLEEFPGEDIKMKSKENTMKCYNLEEFSESSNCLNPQDPDVSGNKNNIVLDEIKADLNSLNKNYLQTAVETFMKNPQLNYLKENTALKKGLCFTWLSNNYVCPNQQCPYSHNALNLFTKKLKQYPSKFIMTVVVSMRNDTLFVDVIMAAFKILSERKIPLIWTTFLIFFVFYVTEPCDSRFLKFWANSARFFCQLNENYAAANGFASLLSIFFQGGKSEEWKIIEFIKVIKQPPVQVSTNYALLQPVLKMDLPIQFLTDAIESCLATQKDVLKVYSEIIPKISLMTSPIKVVELLLKFCETLEVHQIYSHDLKKQIQEKVLSLKTKISDSLYPLAATFQEKLSLNPNNESSFMSYEICHKKKAEISLKLSCTENKYFQLEDEFCNLMTEAIELSSETIPSPFRNADISEKCTGNTNMKNICERQVNRIRQFFRDYQFDLLGKYLNELRPNMIEQAAKEFIKLLFQMKISLHQVVDLVKIILLPCKSKNASKVIANICLALVLNFIRINEWKKAHTIVSLCQDRQINIVEGTVFYFNEFNSITQYRIVLLLIEIYSYKKDYATAVGLVKKHSLFSANHCLSGLTNKTDDEIIRIRILEDLLQQIISSQVTELAYELFKMIWKEQKELLGLFDLRKFVNEILILLLNEDKEDAVTLYEEIKTEVLLNDTTVRAILVTLVRRNRLSSAKSLLLSLNQNAYSLPKITTESVTVKIPNVWLEEEIYVMFDAFFDMLVAEKRKHISGADVNEKEIHVQLLKVNKSSHPHSKLRPLCLGIIKPSFQDSHSRIQKVLQYQFYPPVKLNIRPYSWTLDVYSVKLHLYKRMNHTLGS